MAVSLDGLSCHELQQGDGLQVNAGGLCQQRSLKYFQGLAQGCWLVGWAWLEACAAAGCWVPEEGYEVAGDHVALGAPKAGIMVSRYKGHSCRLQV